MLWQDIFQPQEKRKSCPVDFEECATIFKVKFCQKHKTFKNNSNWLECRNLQNLQG
jgi:hypothetical protein